MWPCRAIRPLAGDHAAACSPSSDTAAVKGLSTQCHTLFAWRQPVGPHVAVAQEGRPVTDRELVGRVAAALRRFDRQQRRAGADTGRALALVETAGGVASPAPSGRLACDAFRPLRLPAVLVADGRLGGVSTSLTSVDALTLRGYDIAAVLLMDQGLGNGRTLREHLGRRGIPVLALPPVPENSGLLRPGPGAFAGLEEGLARWLESATDQMIEARELLAKYHWQLRGSRDALAARADRMLWWPFTQHAQVEPGNVTVIDSRCGDDFLVATPSAVAEKGEGRDVLRPLFDGCASWWTQGVGSEHHPALASAVAYAAGRYGHVMFPENAHGAAVQCAERLLATGGKGWASRVFFSDDGSTAIEIALKMAFRVAACRAERELGQPLDRLVSSPDGLQLEVVGLTNAYHGDTLGAMDAVPPSVYNRSQFPTWYRGRGCFFDPPTVALVNGMWQMDPGPELQAEGVGPASFPSRDALFDRTRDSGPLAESMRRMVRARLDQHPGVREGRVRLGALVMEPVLQGAGGMLMIDPLFQRVLVQGRSREQTPHPAFVHHDLNPPGHPPLTNE